MHIDTNAQNCNFLSVFVSLRGSLSCQWIVRCVVLSLSLSLDQSLLLFSNIFICEGPEKGFPPDSWKMEKTIFKLEGKKNVNFGDQKCIFCQYFNLAEAGIEVVLCVYMCASMYLYFLRCFTHGLWFPEGRKCDLIVCFHKQVGC